jgi:hypothetical protein
MAKRATDSNGRTSRRRDLAAWLMMLLPGFMFVGLLAPAAITVHPQAEETYSLGSFRDFEPRRPLQVPLTIVHSLVPAAGVEPIFSGARYLADQAKRVFELELNAPNAPSADNGKQIVLAEDDVQHYVTDSLFQGESSDQTVLSVDLTPLWNPALFDVIPGLIVRDGFNQWDDFHGTGPGGLRAPPAPAAVPEPTPGVLLALGLAAFASHGRRR